MLSSLQIQIDSLPKEPDWLPVANYIMECESNSNPKAYGARDIKITGHASIGLFQFQPGTFRKYGEKYKVIPLNLSYKELIKAMYDPVKNGAVAHGLMADGEFDHWGNCYKKYKKSALR